MMFIEVDVDLSYALYFATLVYLIGQESRVVDQRFDNLVVVVDDLQDA